MTAVHPRFLLYSGDTWMFDAALHDNAGAALDLTGATVIWRLRNSAQVVKVSLSVGDGLGITVVDPGGGLCRVACPSAETALLAAGIYRDEIQVTLADGFVTTQAVGEISVQRAGLPTAGPDLAAELAALKAARRTGQRRVKIGGDVEVQYGTDAELAAAIASVEREIAQGTPTVRNVYPRSKGWS